MFLFYFIDVIYMDAVISCMNIIHPLLKEVECFLQKSWFLFINRRNDDDVVLLIHLRWRECIFDVISRSLTASPKNVYSLFLSAIRWGCDTALIFFYSQRTRLYFCWISLRSRKSLRDSCIDPLHWTGIKPSLCLSQMVVQSQCPYSYLHTTCQSPNKRSIQQGQKLSKRMSQSPSWWVKILLWTVWVCEKIPLQVMEWFRWSTGINWNAGQDVEWSCIAVLTKKFGGKVFVQPCHSMGEVLEYI